MGLLNAMPGRGKLLITLCVLAPLALFSIGVEHETASQREKPTANGKTRSTPAPALAPRMRIGRAGNRPDIPLLPDLTDTAIRQDYYDRLLSKGSKTLWSLWTRYLDSSDPNETMAWQLAGEALSLRLRADAPNTVLQAIATALEDPSASEALRQQLPPMLGRSATPRTLGILLARTREESDPEQRRQYHEAIWIAANTRWNDRFHPELSPPLETAWSQQRQGSQPSTLNTLASAIARIGANSGVELLLDALANGGSLDEIGADKSPDVLTAAQALATVRNPAAVPLLHNRLMQAEVGTPIYLASGNALANIGGEAATQALLDWARIASDDSAGLARRWFSRIRDTASMEAATRFLDDKTIALSPAIREAISVALGQGG